MVPTSRTSHALRPSRLNTCPASLGVKTRTLTKPPASSHRGRLIQAREQCADYYHPATVRCGMARGRSRTQLPESDQPPHLGLGQGQQTLSGYSTTVNGTVALGRSSNLECIIYLLLELGIRVLPRRRSGRHPWAVGSGFDTGKHIELFYLKTEGRSARRQPKRQPARVVCAVAESAWA